MVLKKRKYALFSACVVRLSSDFPKPLQLNEAAGMTPSAGFSLSAAFEIRTLDYLLPLVLPKIFHP